MDHSLWTIWLINESHQRSNSKLFKSSFYGYKFSREGLNEDRIDRYVHDAVADFTLVYDHTNGWTKGPELNSRRFGHTSFIYDADKKPMVYHVGGGQQEGQAMNGIERWKIGKIFLHRLDRVFLILSELNM